MVDLAGLVLFLRRVGRRIRFLKESIVQNELIRPLRRTLPRLAGLIASPGAGEEPQGTEPVGGGHAVLRTDWCRENCDDEQDAAALEHARNYSRPPRWMWEDLRV